MNDPRFEPYPAGLFERYRRELRGALRRVVRAVERMDCSMANVPVMAEFNHAWADLQRVMPPSAYLLGQSVELRASAAEAWRSRMPSALSRFSKAIVCRIAAIVLERIGY